MKWKKFGILYQVKKMSVQALTAQIRPGQRIFMDDTLSQPRAIPEALGQRDRAGEVADVTLNTTLDVHPVPCYEPGMTGKRNILI